MSNVRAKWPTAEERITAALLSLLRRSPIAKITIQDVAAEAGLSRGTVYNHFGGIHDIALACLRSYYLCMGDGFMDQISPGTNLGELRELVYREAVRSARLICDDPRLYINLETLHHQLRGSAAYDAFGSEVYGRHIQIMRAVCPDESRYRLPPEQIAACLVKVLDHLTRRWSADIPASDADIETVSREASSSYVAVLAGLAGGDAD